MRGIREFIAEEDGIDSGVNFDFGGFDRSCAYF